MVLLFLYARQHKVFVILILYLDDMIITGDHIIGILEVKEYFRTNFKIKDLGSLNYFLGLKILTSNNRMYLSQVKYASNLLSKAGISDKKLRAHLLSLMYTFLLLMEHYCLILPFTRHL